MNRITGYQQSASGLGFFFYLVIKNEGVNEKHTVLCTKCQAANSEVPHTISKDLHTLHWVCTDKYKSAYKTDV